MVRSGERYRPASGRGGLPKHWAWLVVAASLPALAFAVDGTLEAWLREGNRADTAIRILKIVNSIGLPAVILAILGSMPNRRRLWVGFLVPVIGHLPILHLLKWAIGRARPLADEGSGFAAWFSGAPYCDAFPSGHAMSAGVLALLLALYFPRYSWVFYVLVLAIGAERIVTRMHWLSDVLAGYVLAIVVVLAARGLLGPAYYRLDAPDDAGSSVPPGGEPPA